jgi:EAL and modified HD-GYP domain-containing signal transduction protein
MNNSFPAIDGDLATAKLLANTFLSQGLERLSGGQPVYVNFTETLLLEQIPTLFHPDQVMVEVLEDVTPLPAVVEACQTLVAKKYRLVLDDFVYRADLEPLVEMAHVVKIDLRATPFKQLARTVKQLSNKDVTLLAEKVETYQEYKLAMQLGFDLFQGYFFSRPEVLAGKDIAPAKLPLLQIIHEINKTSVDVDLLERIIQSDLSVSYKLLRYINSAYFKRVKEIGSIRQAIVYLGERELRRFVSLIVMAELAEDKPAELIRASIIRARFCELIGELTPANQLTSEYFTLGLFSLIDAMLDSPMEKIMAGLPLTQDLKCALCRDEGQLADVLALVAAYEKGDWERFARLTPAIGIDPETLPHCYLDAIEWARNYDRI